MKAKTDLITMLKQRLGIYLYGPLPLILYMLSTGIVMHFSMILFPVSWMESHSLPHLWSGQVFFETIIWWFFLMVVSTPLPFQLLGGPMSLEFTLTRAIDRTSWLRSERIALIIVGLGPLLLNLALSPLGSSLAFDPPTPGTASALIGERYEYSFPGSQLLLVDSTPKLVIHHGAEMFAAWLVWFGALCIFLAAGYFSIVFKAWQRSGWHYSKSKARPWLGSLMVNFPAYYPILILLLCSGFHVNIFEESFLLFATYPALMVTALVALILFVESLSEKNIQTLEFEFT
ncbi:MAG: hypothetical protein JWN25_2723 [Verrucomicrobiales bacterium]|nr:hypothetical protein [Verrucomicrobiales bacterium]